MVAWGVAPEAAEFLVREIVRERLSNWLIREKDYKSRTPWDVLNGQLSGGDKDERALRRAKAALEKAGAHLDAAQEKDVQTKILPEVDEQHENTNNAPNITPRHQPRRSPSQGRFEVQSPHQQRDRSRDKTPDPDQRHSRPPSYNNNRDQSIRDNRNHPQGHTKHRHSSQSEPFGQNRQQKQLQNQKGHLKPPGCGDEGRSVGNNDSRRVRFNTPTEDASKNNTNRKNLWPPKIPVPGPPDKIGGQQTRFRVIK
ncbi:hypothetical protein QBC36DRAFT_315643 [Triangularia setosa]|uniref:Uncharacterized protein n=1 Tax=Triangularia setosa TaxID=2587417 RepID=A0AAN7A2G1_9PEZI|nr:hypothetical protein QBC36DRAFT_315643 [Podospora setosa]